MSLVLQSSGGGQVTLQEPSTASNRTLTLPDVTGTVASQAYVDTAVAAVPVGGMTLLGTVNTTSGTTQTLSALTLTGYKSLYIVVNGWSSTLASQLYMNTTGTAASGVPIATSLTSNTDTAKSAFYFDLVTALLWGATIRTGASASSFVDVYTSLTSSSTSITFTPSSGSHDAGTISVYGVK